MGEQRRREVLRRARSESDPSRRAALRAELRDLRAWLEPSETPNLYSMSGFGAALFGSYQPGDDGNHVAVLWFTLLGLPVLPLRAYLVRGPTTDGNPRTRGRVPLPPGVRIVKVGIMATGLVGLIALAVNIAS